MRMDARFEEGMIDEVRRLRENGVTWERLESFGLEYREIARHLQGKTSREEMHELLLNSIRQFAKRQDIFFRKMEREGVVIHWLPEGNPDQAAELCRKHLAGIPLPPPEFRMCDIHYPRNCGA
jgi:tRNA dimethylallyltransferase